MRSTGEHSHSCNRLEEVVDGSYDYCTKGSGQCCIFESRWRCRRPFMGGGFSGWTGPVVASTGCEGIEVSAPALCPCRTPVGGGEVRVSVTCCAGHRLTLVRRTQSSVGAVGPGSRPVSIRSAPRDEAIRALSPHRTCVNRHERRPERKPELLNRAHKPPRLDTSNRSEIIEPTTSASDFAAATVPPKGK